MEGQTMVKAEVSTTVDSYINELRDATGYTKAAATAMILEQAAETDMMDVDSFKNNEN